ncbi:serine/threonine-protein kinase [Aquabacterium sp.]|uniref:serine/threonine-protein kinase n=1 Tax=Aquabacterium sp. TaxID=1872578 RepID=UPI004037B916
MQPALLAIILALLVLIAGGLLLWLLRQRRQPPLAHNGFVHTRPVFADTDPVTGASPQVKASPHQGADPDEDAGPETVLSYLDTPSNSAFQSQFSNSMPSLFHEDFASSTMPQALMNLGPHTPTEQMGGQRIQRAMQALGDGPVDQAWQTMQGFFPDAGNRHAALETLERIAVAFESEARYDCARDVYEHIADIDPQWHQVKVRLMRARGLAQVATANTWGTVPARPMPQVAQGQMGKYLVEKQIGKGAMGAVFLGYDPATDRKVALKTMALAQEFSGAELADARNRFLREAEMAGRLKHPDIVSILDAGEQDGVAYIAMELVDGVDMSHYTHPDRLLPLNQLLPILARVADALAYAHTRGVTHRDIKPANIMVDLGRGTVKVMDFGVARVADATRTRTGVVLGTPTFMSPEQLSGQTIDGRSDLYSLGVALFQLLTGQLPYRNDSMAALMRAIGRETAPNVCSIRPDLPPALGDIVALALEKHPNTRYATGQQMAEDLRAVAQSLQGVDLDLG